MGVKVLSLAALNKVGSLTHSCFNGGR
jgi:hypothetical protein